MELIQRPGLKNRILSTEQIGRANEYALRMMEEHTTENFRRTFWFHRFLDRNVYEMWEKDGSKDLHAALNERVRSIFEGHRPPGLSEQIICSIHDIVAAHKPDVNTP